MKMEMFRTRKRWLVPVVGLALLVVAVMSLRAFSPGGIAGHESVEMLPLPPLIQLVGDEGAVGSLDLRYRQNSLLGSIVQVEEGPHVEVSLWQRLKGNGEFTIVAPSARTFTLGNGAEVPGPGLTNVRLVVRLIPPGSRQVSLYGMSMPLEFVSFTSDQMDFVDGQRVWKNGR